MGNTLCKNRVNSNNSKSPVDRVIGRCSQICPKSLGKQKHFWDKQVLETSPPHQTQPKSTNSDWHSATLTVPDSPDHHPVAPPRKKRPSMLRKDESPVRNGFKEIFAGQRSESTTTSDSQGDVKDFTDFEKMPLNRGSEKEKQKREKLAETSRASSEEGTASDHSETKTSTLTHKVSKVGNRKSDKFFGENLSDCLSDQPVVSDDGGEHVEKIHCTVSQTDATPAVSLDKTDEAIANRIKESLYTPVADKRKKLNDAEDAIRDQLMESLENFKDTNKVEGVDEVDRRVAVEEPLIAKTIVKRHICDDEDELRHHLHREESEPGYVVPDPNAPKKPQRDFSKYKKHSEDNKSKANEKAESADESASDLLTQIQKELPSLNAMLTPRDKDKKIIDDITADSIVEELTKELNSEMNRNVDAEGKTAVSEMPMKKLSTSEKTLRRQLSSQSYLTPDLVEEIANQASLHHEYLPEDYSSYTDGSEIAPNSKLIQKRALSTHSSQSDLKQLEKIDAGVKGSSDKLADKVEQVVDSVPSTPVSVEPETPPVDTKLTRPDFPAVMNNPVKLEQILISTKIPETPIRTRTSRLVKQSSTNEDISKALKTFMEKDDLRPEDVLKLLDEEFGEYLNSAALSAEDRGLIDDLRMAVEVSRNDAEDNEKNRPRSRTETENSDDTVVIDDSQLIIETPIVAKITERIPSISEDPRSSAETLVPDSSIESASAINPAIRQISDEKRRHSIDEFDHWFAGSLSKKLEAPVRRRRREMSLPGYLITNFNSEDLKSVKNVLPNSDSEDEVSYEESESTTNKLAQNQPMPVIDTIPEIIDAPLPSARAADVSNDFESHETIEISEIYSELVDTVPEAPASSTETQHTDKSDETSTTEITLTESPTETTAQNHTTNEIHTINLDDVPRLMERGDDKRKSVGHSLLLKFLDVERNNSCQ